MSECNHHYTERGNACVLCFKELQAKLTQYDAAIDAAQGMVAWSYNNFDIDHCEPFDNLKEALAALRAQTI